MITVDEAWAQHSTRVLKLCLRLTGGDLDRAEDLRQEVFLKVCRYITQFRGECAFHTWLHRITMNEFLSQVRSDKSGSQRWSLSLEELGEKKLDGDGDLLDRILLVEDSRLRSTVDRLVVVKALEELSEDHRLLIELHDLQGFTHEEIANLLGGGNVSTVKNQVFRAHRALAAVLGAERSADEALSDLGRYLEQNNETRSGREVSPDAVR